MNLKDVFTRHQFQARVISEAGLEQSIDVLRRDAHVTYPTANLAVLKRIELQAASNSAQLVTATGALTTGTAPQAQKETATCAGTITASGNATVTITSAKLAAPLVLSVPVTNGDTAAQWRAKMADYIYYEPTLHALFTLGGDATHIELTVKDPGPNDSTFNIALANFTCTGITAAPTSANTTVGVGGAVLTGAAASWDADFVTFHYVEIVCTRGHVDITGLALDGVGTTPLRFEEGMMFAGKIDLGSRYANIGFEAVSNDTVVDIIVIGENL